MTRALLGAVLLVVVGWYSWTRRTVVLPLCAVALGVVIAGATGPIGQLEPALDKGRAGFADIANAIFR